jgi:DNA-binding transcriptional ArsR family regulator
MVKQNTYLDGLFGSLADPIRRDILQRLIKSQSTVSPIAQQYNISFAAVSKHLTVLERAKLIKKERRGREQIVRIVPQAMKDASYYLKPYEVLWNNRFNKLDKVLQENL